jgi:hypothetical protein
MVINMVVSNPQPRVHRNAYPRQSKYRITVPARRRRRTDKGSAGCGNPAAGEDREPGAGFPHPAAGFPHPAAGFPHPAPSPVSFLNRVNRPFYTTLYRFSPKTDGDIFFLTGDFFFLTGDFFFLTGDFFFLTG